MDEQTKILYREILERYNKIIWTHKINLCQMDIYLTEKKRQNFILSIHCCPKKIRQNSYY